ncbi:MAG TPA: fumarylacetoacetate hydrolase family protein [Sphingomonas sp.]|uniref:fumarylacetoacetate hydrolase family protein n=1 Tax=Sphingomonas sp. TaxID=28214 RepID=UPI002CA4A69D|nr:fumarylacetoacetate hydrolase family protein [Sphingomonas sp.]HMI19145.1 fumarylacetoacetate hydrolase family protein [Sphingomonas sp.]
MKLVSYNGKRLGVIRDDKVVDVSDLVATSVGEWPPVGMNRLIAHYHGKLPALEAAVAGRPGQPLDSVRLDTPVPWPSKIIAYPANYHAHAEEMGRDYRANTQGFFLKPPSSLSGPNDPIVLPVNAGRRIDHECELGIIIGRACRDVHRDDWRDCVFGYTLLIDAVIRGKEERVARKAFDTFCPVGPWIVTADEVGEPNDLRGRLWVNDELRQDANTRDLVLDVPGMVEMASSIMTLYPGDIIAAGTPEGVGPIRDGETVTIEFDRIGAMKLNVIQGDTGKYSLFAQPAQA